MKIIKIEVTENGTELTIFLQKGERIHGQSLDWYMTPEFLGMLSLEWRAIAEAEFEKRRKEGVVQ